jgi:LPPG:FO 2-phospho-L-lactate transferase
VLLAGGTGGAKLAHGFQQVLRKGELTVVGNVADDLELFGLHVSPDLDSLLYTLAGIVGESGWGVRGDSWTALEMLGRLGEPTWFRIGDADLAVHVTRSRRLRQGESLTQVTRALAASLGIGGAILPASDDPVRTRLQTDAGELDFQTYFVQRAQRDRVRSVRFAGVEEARPSPDVLSALADAQLVVIAPSNPIVSIGPILAIPGMTEALRGSRAVRVAVSPIIGGRALKGPADRMLASLGHEVSALGVARLYAGLVDRFVLDEQDAVLAASIQALGMSADVLPTVMETDEHRARLAAAILSASGAILDR